MKYGPGFLSLLRRERSALSALAITVMLLRVLLGVAGLAMVPAGAEAAGAPGLILCSGAGGGASPVKGNPSALLDCPCAACHHAGCALACPAPTGAAALQPAGYARQLRPVAPADVILDAARAGDPSRIRAPPPLA